MLHPHTELKFVSTEIGYGVFATEDIPMGTITWVQDELDRVIKKEDIKNFSKPNLENLFKYTYRNKNGDFFFCWDLTRFINHCFLPNTMLTGLGFEIALTHIKSGEEITNDYGTLNIVEPFKCSVGKDAREYVRPNDLEIFYHRWDGWINTALPFVFKVDQPLEVFLTSEQLSLLREIESGDHKIPTILNNYYHASE
jgi:hypothetical protein